MQHKFSLTDGNSVVAFNADTKAELEEAAKQAVGVLWQIMHPEETEALLAKARSLAAKPA